MKTLLLVWFAALLLLACSPSKTPEATSEAPRTSEKGEAQVSESAVAPLPNASSASPTELPTTAPPLGFAALLEKLAQETGIGIDAAFTSLLDAGQKRPDHKAPQRLRDFLQLSAIPRFEIQQGFTWVDEHPTLVWFFSELGFEGEEAALRAKVVSQLEGAGFEAVEPWAFEKGYRRNGEGVVEQVATEGPNGWTGGEKAAAGMTLLWTVASTQAIAAPTFGEVVAALPYLVDERIDPALYAALAPLPCVNATLGGTWTRYYSLSVDVQADKDARHTLVMTLYDLGFEPIAKDRPTTFKTATGSHAQLSFPSDEGIVSLHFQPES